MPPGADEAGKIYRSRESMNKEIARICREIGLTDIENNCAWMPSREAGIAYKGDGRAVILDSCGIPHGPDGWSACGQTDGYPIENCLDVIRFREFEDWGWVHP